MVRDSVFLGGRLNDRTDGRVMDATYLGEEVMLNLIVQPTDVPRKWQVLLREVRSRTHFVNDPGLLHLPVNIRGWILRTFDNMGKLKNDTKDNAGREVHRHETNQELPPCDIQNQQWEHDGIEVAEQFGGEENRYLLRRMNLVGVRPNILLQELLIIFSKDPIDRRKPIRQESIKMLKSVKPLDV